MSRSKRDAELASILENFCNNIIQLDQQASEFQSNYLAEKKQNMEKITNLQEVLANLKMDVEAGKPHSFSSSEYTVYSLLVGRKSAFNLVKMNFNAQFLYMFTLFEKFLSETVKASVRQDENIRKKFVNYAECRQSKCKDSRYIGVFDDPNKLQETYGEFPIPPHILCKIFAVKANDKIFHQHWCRYIEGRERRNLLTHRGEKLDKRYFLNTKEKLEKCGQQADKFLNDEILKDYEEKINSSNIGKKKIPADVIPIYLRKVTLALLYIAHIVHMTAFRESNKYYQTKGSHFLDSGHSLLLHSYDQDSINFALIFREILVYYKNYICENALNDWFLIEKVNFCLLYKFIIEHMNEWVKQYNMNNKKKLDELPMIDFENVLSDCDAKYDNYREIALAHFRKDKKNLIKYSKKVKLTKREFDDWFLFREWQSDADVKAFFEKIADKKS